MSMGDVIFWIGVAFGAIIVLGLLLVGCIVVYVCLRERK